jgi:multiple sugar transport system permease protein
MFSRLITRSLGAALILAVSVVVLAPYVWMVSGSLTPSGEVFSSSLNVLPSHPTLNAYQRAWDTYPVGRFLANSIVVAGAETAFVVLTSVLAGYAFARMRFPGRTVLFLCVLGTLMVPAQVTMIPSFIVMRWFGWVDTYQGLIAPRIVAAFGIFLVRQALLAVPRDLEDAAKIDGAGRLRIVSQIMVPAVAPTIAALAVLAFTNAWNEFFWPLIVTSTTDMKTIQVALAGIRGGEIVDWPMLLALTAMSAIPTLAAYFVLLRYFVRGFVLSGMKG